MVRPAQVHALKSWPASFEAVLNRRKRYEWRLDDGHPLRDYQVDDMLLLQEWNPDTDEFSGRSLIAVIQHITRGGEYNLPEGSIVMDIEVILDRDPK